MHNKQHSTTLWMVVALLGCGLALIALAGQVVSAQPLVNELKPPFGFAELPMAPEAQTPPPGSAVLLTENFGTSFNPTTSLTGSTPLWRKFVNPGDTAGYYWNKVSAGAFSNSAWSAAEPITSAPMLTPGVSNYPAGQDTWLIYGPIDLSRFVYGHVSFEYYLDSQAGDTLLWGYSTDGQTFYGNSQSGPLSKWITDTFSFRANSAFQTVYLGFAFNSHASPQGKGSFVRNVRLTGEPLKFGYLPLVMSNYAAPTPTPIPPLYGYYFDEPDPRGPGSDLSLWGGQFYDDTRKGDYGPYAYGQDVRIGHGNPGNSLTLYTTASYVVNASSPNNLAPADFDLYVDMSPWRLYPDNRYGIVFNASDSTFGTTPAQFNSKGQFYLLYVGTGPTVAPLGIRLDRCSGGGCTRVSGNTQNDGYIALPPSFVGNASAFDTIHLQRQGSQISVWANDVLMFSLTDGTYAAYRKWGLFILPFTNNATVPPTGSQMQVDFDNVRMYTR